MKIGNGSGTSEFGPGVNIDLDGDELSTAIDAYLVAQDINVTGPRTITVNGGLCDCASIYVDPLGFVIYGGRKFDGRR